MTLVEVHKLSEKCSDLLLQDFYVALLSEIYHCSWLTPHWTLEWNVVHMYRSAIESETSQWACVYDVKYTKVFFSFLSLSPLSSTSSPIFGIKYDRDNNMYVCMQIMCVCVCGCECTYAHISCWLFVISRWGFLFIGMWYMQSNETFQSSLLYLG